MEPVPRGVERTILALLRAAEDVLSASSAGTNTPLRNP
jgi:hypothetical protein